MLASVSHFMTCEPAKPFHSSKKISETGLGEIRWNLDMIDTVTGWTIRSLSASEQEISWNHLSLLCSLTLICKGLVCPVIMLGNECKSSWTWAIIQHTKKEINKQTYNYMLRRALWGKLAWMLSACSSYWCWAWTCDLLRSMEHELTWYRQRP